MAELSVLLGVLGVVLAIIIIRKLSYNTSNKDTASIKTELDFMQRFLREELPRMRAELLSITSENRMELIAVLKQNSDSQLLQANTLRTEINGLLAELGKQINLDAARNRTELSKTLDNLTESLSRKIAELTVMHETQSETLKRSLDERMEIIRSSNEKKLEDMRKTVDEKLHETLEKRLGESFQQVSQRLEEVHKGLGEMRNLAGGVGDLKKALMGVKTRGVLGEVQLGNLLEEILTNEQYEKNFKPNRRRDEIVEYAIRLPGKEDRDAAVYLPIDAKFPIEDYHRLIDAYELGDVSAIDSSRKNMVQRIKACARDIRDKYLNPPQTTEFAILFLPFESLYAEVLRIPGLFELVMREYNVILSGPTTIAALLNSLQVGFRTMAIQKKSSEVWKVLAAVKKDFSNFADILEKTRRKIDDAGRELDNASLRSNQIVKKLTKVQEYPIEEQAPIIALADREISID